MVSKQVIAVNFAKGLDLKTDPFQVALGNFLALDNSVFTTGNRLTKRNGYELLSSLPNTTYSYLTTLNDNLTALGPSIAAYDASTETWGTRGSIAPLTVSTLPLIRNNLNQTQLDTAVSPNGLVCTVYTEFNGSTSDYKYAIASNTTGQNIAAPALIPVTTGTITGSPRVFVLGTYFVIVFTNTIGGSPHLQYISIPSTNPTSTPSPNIDIASGYTPASTSLPRS